MRIDNIRWLARGGWQWHDAPADADLILYFGSVEAIEAAAAPETLSRYAPGAVVLGCSTTGGILGSSVDETGLVGVACRFSNTKVRLVEAQVSDASHSGDAGHQLGQALLGEDLAGAFVLSDGVDVDGSAITASIVDVLGANIPVSGGLAGDGARFVRTVVGAGFSAGPGRAAAVGFYGRSLRMAHASAGGWEPFGPKRRITASQGCVLHELDGKPALALYERYLGDEAAGLPGTALLFPLMVWDPENPYETRVRTVLSIDRDTGTMTFAGSIPLGWGAQLMRGNFDGLVNGAGQAGRIARSQFESPASGQTLAILISCIGRQLVLGQRTAEELDAVLQGINPVMNGPGLTRVGFYSHGEIAPRERCSPAILHNQTMTVTLLAETL